MTVRKCRICNFRNSVMHFRHNVFRLQISQNNLFGGSNVRCMPIPHSIGGLFATLTHFEIKFSFLQIFIAATVDVVPYETEAPPSGKSQVISLLLYLDKEDSFVSLCARHRTFSFL